MGVRLHGASNETRAEHVQLDAQAAEHFLCQPRSDANSPGMQQARLRFHSARICNHPVIDHTVQPYACRGCGCIAAAREREMNAYSLLLRQLDTARASPGAMPTRLVCNRLAYASIPPASATTR